MIPRPHLGRTAGLVVPLFSLRSARSWGIGDIGDLAPFGAWLRRAGFRALQLLPVGTLPAGETSPYSALSAMAIDPVYVVGARRARLPRARRRVAVAAGRSGRAPDRPSRPPCPVRRRAAGERCGAPAGVQPLLRRRLAARHGARGIVCGVCVVGRLVARRLRALLRAARAPRRPVRGPTGRWRSDRRQPDALEEARRALEREILYPPVRAVDRRRAVGTTRARRSARSGCSATCPSWSAPTAPTSGRTSTCSASIAPSARRPMPSARPGRTGACPSTAGT